MAKYRKKPVVIDAIEWYLDHLVEVMDFMGNPDPATIIGRSLVIPTLEGDLLAAEGDFIIKGIKGEYYPCKPDIFEATYEKVEE